MWNGVRRTCDALHSYSGSYFPNLDTAKTKARNSAPLLSVANAAYQKQARNEA